MYLQYNFRPIHTVCIDTLRVFLSYNYIIFKLVLLPSPNTAQKTADVYFI
jgi:hypothetical protein